MKNLKILITLDERLYQTLIKMKDIGLGKYNEAIINGTVVPDDCEIQSKSSDYACVSREQLENIIEDCRCYNDNYFREIGDGAFYCDKDKLEERIDELFKQPTDKEQIDNNNKQHLI